MLKQRGLIVSDEDTALRQLASISYFRLASYWKIFETDEATHQFATIHLFGKLDAQSYRPSQLLCPSCTGMEPTLSYYATTAKAIAAYMG